MVGSSDVRAYKLARLRQLGERHPLLQGRLLQVLLQHFHPEHRASVPREPARVRRRQTSLRLRLQLRVHALGSLSSAANLLQHLPASGASHGRDNAPLTRLPRTHRLVSLGSRDRDPSRPALDRLVSAYRRASRATVASCSTLSTLGTHRSFRNDWQLTILSDLKMSVTFFYVK